MSLNQGSRVLIRNNVSSGICSSERDGAEGDGKEQSNSAKTRDFLDLVAINSKSNSCRITIHFEYLPPSSRRNKMYVIGLQSEITVVVRNRI